MHTVVFCSFKGGTAKTSTTLHIGAALAAFHNKKVLLIDFDPQADLSIGLGFSVDDDDTMVPVLQGEKSIKDVVKETSISGLHLVTGNTYLDMIEATAPLVSDPYAHERLRKCLKNLDYDFCLIDIPPSFGWLCQSAFFASQYSVICAVPQPYSMQALKRLAKYHRAINENHNISLMGVVFSLWDERGATNKVFMESVEDVFPGKIFQTKIRKDISVDRAILEGKPVFETAPSSRVVEDYRSLVEEFLERTKVNTTELVGV